MVAQSENIKTSMAKNFRKVVRVGDIGKGERLNALTRPVFHR